MIDDFAIADPAEETLALSGDTSLEPSSDDTGEQTSVLYMSPVLDRIRTSD